MLPPGASTASPAPWLESQHLGGFTAGAPRGGLAPPPPDPQSKHPAAQRHPAG